MNDKFTKEDYKGMDEYYSDTAKQYALDTFRKNGMVKDNFGDSPITNKNCLELIDTANKIMIALRAAFYRDKVSYYD